MLKLFYRIFEDINKKIHSGNNIFESISTAFRYFNIVIKIAQKITNMTECFLIFSNQIILFQNRFFMSKRYNDLFDS